MGNLIEKANHGDVESMIQLGDDISNVAETINDLLKAINWYEMALKRGSSVGGAKAANTYLGIAQVLQNNGDYQNSFKCWVKAIKTAEEVEKKEDAYFDICLKIHDEAIYGKAILLYLNNQAKDAIECISESEQLGLYSKKGRSTVLRALCTFTMGNSLSEYDSAAVSLFRLCLGQDGYVNQNELGQADEKEQAIYATTVKLFCKLILDGTFLRFNTANFDREGYTLIANNVANRSLTSEKAIKILQNAQ